MKSAHLIPSISLHEDGLIFCSILKRRIWFQQRRARQIKCCYPFCLKTEFWHQKIVSNLNMSIFHLVLQQAKAEQYSAAEHENHSHLFIASLASQTCLKQQKIGESGSIMCKMRCCRTSQLLSAYICSLPIFFIRTYFSLPFFHLHLLFFAIVLCCMQTAEQNRTGLPGTTINCRGIFPEGRIKKYNY